MNNAAASETRTETQTCNTCCGASHTPFRSYSPDGKIVHGCIDDFHTEALKGIISASASWHFRPVAKQMRVVAKKRLRALLARR